VAFDGTLGSLTIGLDDAFHLHLGGHLVISSEWGDRRIEASADLVDAPDGLARSWLAGVGGQGRIDFTGGSIASDALFQAVARGIVSGIPGISRLQRPQEPTPALLEHVRASFQIVSAGLRSEDLEIVTSDYRIEGRGVLAPDGSVDFGFRVKFNSLGLARIRQLTFLHKLPTPPRPLPRIPVDVSGTIVEPIFKPDLSEISLATLGWLPGMAGRLMEGTFEAGRGAAHEAGAVFDKLKPAEHPEEE
jgi:hypothetical protein